MSPFSWQCQNLCLLSLVFIIDWRVVAGNSIAKYQNHSKVELHLMDEAKDKLEDMDDVSLGKI